MPPTLSKEYERLIKRFPLRPIRTCEQHQLALTVVAALMERDEKTLTSDETDYLMVLSGLVEDYESTLPELQEFLADLEAVTPAEALGFLMEQNDLTQTQLSAELGIDQGSLSAFLNGKRGLSKANVVKLAKRFRVAERIFLPKQ